MARLVFCYPEVVLSFGGCVRFRIANQELLKALDRLFKVFKVEFCLSLPENHLTDEVFRWQKADETVMFAIIGVQDDEGRGPFDTEAIDQSLILVEIDLERNEVLLNGKTDIGVRISNSFQLLAPYSEVIVKIHQDQSLLLPCLRLCLR